MYDALPIHMIVALVGATIIITRGTIFRGFQQGRARVFFACSLCVGFWVGSVTMLVLRLPSTPWKGFVDFMLDGSSVALLSLAADAVLIRLLGEPE